MVRRLLIGDPSSSCMVIPGDRCFSEWLTWMGSIWKLRCSRKMTLYYSVSLCVCVCVGGGGGGTMLTYWLNIFLHSAV